MRKIRERVLACVLAITLCVCTINMPVQAEVSNDLEQISTDMVESEEGSSVAESEEVVESEIETTIVEEKASWDGHTTEAVFEENDYRILFTLGIIMIQL